MIDAFEQKHGPVEDRSIFDGEIVVPPHLRNMSFTSLRSNRLHSSLFGSVPRSRTLFSVPPNARCSLHGSVPDLSRHSSPFPFNSNINSVDNDDDSRRMSSASTIPDTVTKITLNTSTTLALTNNNLKSHRSNGRTANHLTFGKNAHAIHSIDEHRRLDNDVNDAADDDDAYKSNSIRSLNDIQLRERSGMEQDRTLYCQSLGRPNRAQKMANYKKIRSQPQSLDAYNSEGYMTLIKTNLASSHGRYQNRASTPIMMHDDHANNINSPLNSSTSTFQRKAAAPPPPPPPPPPSKSSKKSNHFNQLPSNAGFTNDLTLNNLTKFKLPRVSLNHSVTNPQQ